MKRRSALDDFEVGSVREADYTPSLSDIPRQQPDGLSDNEDAFSEWDTMSVVETFGRGRMLYDFHSDSAEVNCLKVNQGDIVEVSLRPSSDGWTRARELTGSREGFIPTSYFQLTD